MSTQTKAQLERKKTKIRASRVLLSWGLVVEAFIFLMCYPRFLGWDWIENALTWLRNAIVGFLWPANAADMVTYKGTIYDFCTMIQGLPGYDILSRVVICLFPVLFVLTFIRIKILNWRIEQIDNPPPPRQPRRFKEKSERKDKPQKELKPQTGGDSMFQDWFSESGLTPQEAKDANTYCEKHRERCDDPFSRDPGLRIQRPTGEIGLGESRDFVKPWDANDEIDLTAILKRPVKVKLEKGKPYIYVKDAFNKVVKSPVPMRRYDPMGFNAIDDNEKTVICVITWLGG